MPESGSNVALVRDHRAVVRLPPVAREELRHHAVAAAAVPDQHAAGLEHARELARSRARRRAGSRKKPNDGEQIEHRVEAAGPLAREACACRRACSAGSGPCRARLRDVEEMARVVEPVDVEARFGEQMRVAPLSARHVEQSRRRRAARAARSAARLRARSRAGEKIGSYSSRYCASKYDSHHSRGASLSLSRSEEHRLAVRAEHLFHRRADLVQRAVRARAVEDVRNEILRACARPP